MNGPPVNGPEHVGEHLSAYLDGELSAAEKATVEAHLRECAPCARWLEELQAVDDFAQDLPVGAPEGYFDSFPGRVRERLAARRRPRLPVWTWAAAAAVLLAVITPLTLMDRGPANSPPATVAERSQDAQLEKRPAAGPAAPVASVPLPAKPATTTTRGQPEPSLREAPVVVTGDAPIIVTGPLDRLEERDASKDDARTSAGGFADGKLKSESGNERRRDETAAYRRAFEKEGGARPAPTAAAAAPPAPPPPPSSAPATADEDMAVEGMKAGERQKAEPKAVEASPSGEVALRKGRRSGQDNFAQQAAAAAPEPPDFDTLARSTATSATQARALFGQWSAFAVSNRGTPKGDEARVRAMEALALAWKLGASHADRTLARALGEAYVAEPGPQKERVRRLLETLAR